MNIAIIGLGLIGGSIAKSLKKHTKHDIYGFDIDKNTLKNALDTGAIDNVLNLKDLKNIDICFICLFPKDTVNFIKENISNFKKDSIITDVCGIKEYIKEQVENLCLQNSLNYIGGHPMAGKEKGGYINSDENLLFNASYILTLTDKTNNNALSKLYQLIKDIGSNVITCQAKTHDKIIAYTSQLAHIVSSGYVKSSTINLENGFTGGSFQDMTRVALLDENMWTDLFMLNKDNLSKELDNLISNLNEFKKALNNNDENSLKELLKEGKEIKSKHLK